MKLKTIIILLLIVGGIACITSPQSPGLVSELYKPYTSPLNSHWNGTSILFEDLRNNRRVEVLNTWDKLLDFSGENITLIIIAPETEFTEREILVLRRFLEDNRVNIIIADELWKTGNSIIKPLLNASLGKGFIVTKLPSGELSYFQNTTWTLNNVSYRILLNKAGYINETGLLTPIFYSNSSLEIMIVYNNETVRGLSRERATIGGIGVLGDDKIVIIADSSLFINQCWIYQEEFGDNYNFSKNLILEYSREHIILFDNSHYIKQESISELVNTYTKISGIPPIGLLVSLLVASLLYFSEGVLNSISSSSIPAVAAASIIIAVILNKVLSYGEVEKGSRESASVEEEKVFLKPSLHLSKIVSGATSFSEQAKQSISIFYEELRRQVYLKYGVNIDHAEPPRELSNYSKTIKLMKKVYEAYNGKRRMIFPPIFRWGKLLRESYYCLKHVTGRGI